MSLLGTATTRPGRVCDRAGTSEGVNLCAREPLGDPRLIDLPHIVEPLCNVSGIISTSGRAVEWFKELGGSGVDYEGFLEEARQAASGSDRLLFLPYLCGERAPIWDSSARGVFLGLSLGHGRREMARAVLEGTAFAMRDVIEVMESRGAAVTELRITGTPARSAVWNQIKADITGKPLSVPEVEEAELMGGACLGLRALGRFSRLDEAAESLVRLKKTYAPDPEAAGLYGKMFEIYRGAYAALKSVFKGLEAVSP
jgi:xylulokinase